MPLPKHLYHINIPAIYASRPATKVIPNVINHFLLANSKLALIKLELDVSRLKAYITINRLKGINGNTHNNSANKLIPKWANDKLIVLNDTVSQEKRNNHPCQLYPYPFDA